MAAGFGMHMVLINTEMPKGLLEVNSEPLIEHIIKWFHEVGIGEIYVIVVFMKEKYEEDETMYITLSDLIQIGILIVGIIGLF